MKSVVIVPIKKDSERIIGKNFIVFNGRPLYQIFPMTLLGSGVFDQVCIDTDSSEIAQWCDTVGIKVLWRDADLIQNWASGNVLLRDHAARLPGYESYWQGFVTSPNITVETVRGMHEILGRPYDSVLTVKRHYGFFWSNGGQPLSYRPEVMPRSQDLKPIYQEICGLFGVTAQGLRVTACRTGADPYFYSLPEKEAKDIDWPEDLL